MKSKVHRLGTYTISPDNDSGGESGGQRSLPWHGREGKGAGRGRRRGREERLSSISPGLAGVDGKLEGKVRSADCLVGQRTGGQVAMPTNAIQPSQV